MVVLLAVLAVLAVWLLLRASLPELAGERNAASLSAAISIERDSRGVPTISGSTQRDVAFGLGFVHGQDRFFQMDLARRLAAGELAALFGPAALEHDRQARPLQLRQVAARVAEKESPENRGWIEAYARGVNAGLASLDARPWEYWLLRSRPEPWRTEDTVLAVHAIWWQLQYGDIERERQRNLVAAAVRSRDTPDSIGDATASERLLQFLYPMGTEWDAPNFASLAEAASAAADLQRRAAPPLPGPREFSLRESPAAPTDAAAPASGIARSMPGSNNWAISGQRTGSGAALVANDMHLGLGVPIIWYHARLRFTGADKSVQEQTGVTLPGAPAIIAGTNGRIAWGFTNAYGDWLDLIQVSCDLRHNQYATEAGAQRFTLTRDTIRVRGADDVEIEIRDSALGVLIGQDPATGTCELLRWLVREPGATNLRLREFALSGSVGEALNLAPQIGVPQLNLVVGDRDGNIGWALLGRVPVDARGPRTPTPIVWRGEGAGLAIENPEIGAVWSANSRAVEGAMEAPISGDESVLGAHYDFGARARQIRDALLERKAPADEAQMLALQLDDRALFLQRWRDLMLGLLDERAVMNQPRRLQARGLLLNWAARASVDAVGYRLVREFRTRMEQRVWAALMAGLGLQAGRTAPGAQFEATLWRLVTEQPPHLLAPGQELWRDWLLETLDATILEMVGRCERLERCTWGSFAPVEIRHPLSGAVPGLGRLIDMPERELAGDHDVPRVQRGAFGASQRFAVSPGREQFGYMQLAGGQSGHPLSPFYRSMFDDWADGVPSSFLPGPTQYRMTLRP